MLDKILKPIDVGATFLYEKDLYLWFLLILTLPAWAPLWGLGIVVTWVKGRPTG